MQARANQLIMLYLLGKAANKELPIEVAPEKEIYIFYLIGVYFLV
jgi:hypothetical protein